MVDQPEGRFYQGFGCGFILARNGLPQLAHLVTQRCAMHPVERFSFPRLFDAL